jgi:poly(A) polymerase
MFKKHYWSALKGVFQRKREKKRLPKVIQRQHHSISRDEISPSALKVLYRLKEQGFSAYLVGGGVRDVLLGLHPKDFDVATDARPSQVRRTFRNSRIIGRRFRLVHVYFSEEIIEVSTFRANATPAITENSTEASQKIIQNELPAILLEDNTYGTIEQDAWRRDFTINALYYDIADRSVIDFTEGLPDLHNRVIRMIGDPVQRFHEDPVRLLRAIRLAAKLNFSIHPDTEKALLHLHYLIPHVPPARLFTEFLKIFFKGHAERSYQLLKKTGYLEILFPHTANIIKKYPEANYEKLLHLALQATDSRYDHQESLNPGFLLSAFVWPVIQEYINDHKEQKLFAALHGAIHEILPIQTQTLGVSHRLRLMMRSISILQYHLERRRLSRIYRIANQRYFRAALDFFELRAEIDGRLAKAAQWWRAFRESDNLGRKELMNELV